MATKVTVRRPEESAPVLIKDVLYGAGLFWKGEACLKVHGGNCPPNRMCILSLVTWCVHVVPPDTPVVPVASVDIVVTELPE